MRSAEHSVTERPGPADAFYPRPIELRGLRPGVLQKRDLGAGVEVVVIREGDIVHVLREVCPHMGGPLSEATYCRKDGTLECPWHGYVFDVATGALKDNPNERIMASMRQPTECFRPDRTPRYALTRLAYTVVGDRAYVSRTRGRE
jgi:nitrite reductase/ring-hydroxylating ferredoxin subunit